MLMYSSIKEIKSKILAVCRAATAQIRTITTLNGSIDAYILACKQIPFVLALCSRTLLSHTP